MKSKTKEKHAETLTQDYIITREYPNHINAYTQTDAHMVVWTYYTHCVCTNRMVRRVCMETRTALEGVTSPLVCVCV